MKILIADNHELVRSGIRYALEKEADFEVVGEASNGTQAIEMASSCRPDAVVMDVRMPGVDGVAACRNITKANPGVKVLMLSVYDDDSDVFDAIEAGASGFMIKDISSRDLAVALRTLAGGRSYFHPIIAKKIGDRIKNMGKQDRQRMKICEALTRRELEVLELIGQGNSNGDISRALFICEATVKTHVSSLLRKLEKRDRTQLALFARENRLTG